MNVHAHLHNLKRLYQSIGLLLALQRAVSEIVDNRIRKTLFVAYLISWVSSLVRKVNPYNIDDRGCGEKYFEKRKVFETIVENAMRNVNNRSMVRAWRHNFVKRRSTFW